SLPLTRLPEAEARLTLALDRVELVASLASTVAVASASVSARVAGVELQAARVSAQALASRMVFIRESPGGGKGRCRTKLARGGFSISEARPGGALKPRPARA